MFTDEPETPIIDTAIRNNAIKLTEIRDRVLADNITFANGYFKSPEKNIKNKNANKKYILKHTASCLIHSSHIHFAVNSKSSLVGVLLLQERFV